jgi:predicted lipase
MYTYGAPRVGNKSFADAFNERLKGDAWRITNKADIVPRCVYVARRFLETFEWMSGCIS